MQHMPAGGTKCPHITGRLHEVDDGYRAPFAHPEIPKDLPTDDGNSEHQRNRGNYPHEAGDHVEGPGIVVFLLSIMTT